MEGNDVAFEKALARAMRDTSIFSWPFVVVEIGTASAGTTKGIAAFVEYAYGLASPQESVPYEIHTFDIPDGWSFFQKDVEAAQKIYPSITSHVLPGGGRAALEDPSWTRRIGFAFIDGCHGAPCAKADFEAVERHSVIGTVVVFHDTNVRCQGMHLQPHCQTGIDVRNALLQLGLLNNTRPGWTMIEETNPAHGIAVFQRTA
jgi:hypothetical protein